MIKYLNKKYFIMLMVMFLCVFTINVENAFAYDVELIGEGELVMPKDSINMVSGYDKFAETYIPLETLQEFTNIYWPIIDYKKISSREQYSDLVANGLQNKEFNINAKQTISLKDNISYNDATKILTIDNKEYNLKTDILEIPSSIIYLNEPFEHVLTAYGKKERGIYYSSLIYSGYLYKASENELTFYKMYIPIYLETIAEIEARDTLINKLAQTINETMSDATDIEKAYFLYSYLSRFVTYTNETNTSPHIASSLALEYKAVCQAIAYIYQAVGEKVGLEMKYITGYVGETGYHAWNLIKINGKWYHTDATWGVYKIEGGNANMEERYIVYNQYFLFTLDRSERNLDESTLQLMERENIVTEDKTYNPFVNYKNLGGGIYNNILITYKDKKIYFIDMKTNITLKTIELETVNKNYHRAALVNNEYYFIYKDTKKKNTYYIDVTNLDTLQTKRYETLTDVNILAFVDKGILVEDVKTKVQSIVPYTSNQKKLAKDKLFLTKLDKNKLYYVSDKALVNSRIDLNAINRRVESFRLTQTNIK